MKHWGKIITILLVIMIGIFSYQYVVDNHLIQYESIRKEKIIKQNTHWSHDYGVFLSVTPKDNWHQLTGYNILVIDAQYFSPKQINWLKKHNHRVLSYMNIGAIESFRPYYHQYYPYTFKAYDNWNEERWIDVNQYEWQTFLTQQLSKQLLAKHIDGLWLDNLDIYDFKHSKKTYKNLCNILLRLQKQTDFLIINGADTFVQQAIKEKHHYFTGVNQETVFTAIDFDSNTLHAQKKSETQYYLNYLNHVKQKGYQIYLLEYTTDDRLKKKIKEYCHKHHDYYYISNSIELDGL